MVGMAPTPSNPGVRSVKRRTRAVNRIRALTVGGALLAALILGVFAYLIADAQSEDEGERRGALPGRRPGVRRRDERDLPVGVPVDADAGRRGLLGPDRAVRAYGVRRAGSIALRGGVRRQGAAYRRNRGPSASRARRRYRTASPGKPRLSDVMGTGRQGHDRVRDSVRDALGPARLRHGLSHPAVRRLPRGVTRRAADRPRTPRRQ